MKKKVVALCATVALAAVALGGATLAYFTDTDSANNTFTVGNVKIDLIEQQRGEVDGEGGGKVTGLVDFEQGKTLMPIVGSAQGEKDEFGLPTAENYVDKIVNVKNTGKSDAYVRVIVAVPASLEGATAATNILHWNVGNKFTAEGDYDTTATTQPTNLAWSDVTYKDLNTTQVISGITYNLYSFTYEKALAADETTKAASFVGFYLDKDVDCKYEKQADGTEKLVYTKNGEELKYDLTKGVTIPVFAQAVQAAGFSSADAAFAAASMPTNPWGE